MSDREEGTRDLTNFESSLFELILEGILFPTDEVNSGAP